MWTHVCVIMQGFSEHAHLSPGDPDELRALSEQVLVACETLLSNRLSDMPVLCTLGRVTGVKGHCASYLLYFQKIFFSFREKVREGKERERNINVRLPLIHPLLGIWLVTQACTLNGCDTIYPLVLRLALNPLSHSSQGSFLPSSVHKCLGFFCFTWVVGPLSCTPGLP